MMLGFKIHFVKSDVRSRFVPWPAAGRLGWAAAVRVMGGYGMAHLADECPVGALRSGQSSLRKRFGRRAHATPMRLLAWRIGLVRWVESSTRSAQLPPPTSFARSQQRSELRSCVLLVGGAPR